MSRIIRVDKSGPSMKISRNVQCLDVIHTRVNVTDDVSTVPRDEYIHVHIIIYYIDQIELLLEL